MEKARFWILLWTAALVAVAPGASARNVDGRAGTALPWDSVDPVTAAMGRLGNFGAPAAPPTAAVSEARKISDVERSREGFCRTAPVEWINEAHRRLDTGVSHHLWFGNFGVIGTCWWHDELTRNLNYLAIFDPGARKPTAQELYALMDIVMTGHGPVVLGGYSDIREFSAERAEELKRYLTLRHWAFYAGPWNWADLFRGLNQDREGHRKMWRSVERYLAEGLTPILRTRYSATMFHSMILTDLRLDSEGDPVSMRYGDSNYPGIVLRRTFPYKEDLDYFYQSSGLFLDKQHNLRAIRNSIQYAHQNYCRDGGYVGPAPRPNSVLGDDGQDPLVGQY